MNRRDILLLLISSVIVVIAWIAFSIVHQFMSSTITDTTNQAITPITSSFDISVINTLKTREKIAPVLAVTAATQSGTTNTPTIPISTPTPTIASSSGTPGVNLIQPTRIATQGGTTR